MKNTKTKIKLICNQCGKPMEFGIGIQNTNIAFPILYTGKIYQNDDKLIRVCDNPECPNFGLLQVCIKKKQK